MYRITATALLVALSATPLVSDVDCSKPYTSFVKMLPYSLSGNDLAAAHRAALRILDACDTGHLADPEYRLRQLQEKYTMH